MTTDVPEGVTPFDKLNLGFDEPLDRDFDVITEPDNREDVTGDVEDDLSVTDLVNYGKQVVQAADAGLEIMESIVKATGNQTAIQAVTALRNSIKVADSSLQLWASQRPCRNRSTRRFRLSAVHSRRIRYSPRKVD